MQSGKFLMKQDLSIARSAATAIAPGGEPRTGNEKARVEEPAPG